MSKYPKVREIKKRGLGGVCGFCRKPNSGRYDVHININGFRGDDDVIKLCEPCRIHKRPGEILGMLGYL